MVGPHADINAQNIVENVMQCDDNWPVAAGHILVATDGSVGIGDTYNPVTHLFTKAPPTQDQIDAETRAQIIALAKQAMAQLQTIIGRTQPTFSTIAQAQTWARQAQQDIQFEAQVLRRIIRFVGNMLDGTN